MPGGQEGDQCPFCNALWGECRHVRLLLEWETDALVREAEAELGSAVAAEEPKTDAAPPFSDDLSTGSQGGQG